MNNKKSVSNKSLGGRRDSAGIGYVIIPRDKDKKSYVQHCLRTGTISLILENGGIIDNVLITKSALNLIDFPEDYDSLGSMLVWINQPRKLQPIVIGLLSKADEFIDFNKETTGFKRANKNYVGNVLVDANKGVVIINSSSTTETNGDIYIFSYNKNKDSKLKVRVSGSVEVDSQYFNLTNSKKLTLTIKDEEIDKKVTSISYEKTKGFTYKDEFDNEMNFKEDLMEIKPNKSFHIGDGNEPMMLSETFKGIFEDFTDIMSDFSKAVAALTVTITSPGNPSTVPVNVTSFIEITAKLKAIKLKYKNFQSGQSSLD